MRTLSCRIIVVLCFFVTPYSLCMLKKTPATPHPITTKGKAKEQVKQPQPAQKVGFASPQTNDPLNTSVAQLREWKDFIKRAKETMDGTKTAQQKRINNKQGSWEYQHIGPWREKKKLLLKAAILRDSIWHLNLKYKSEQLKNLYLSAYPLSHCVSAPEKAWRKIVTPQITRLFDIVRQVDSLQNNAVLWKNRVATVPDNQAPSIVSLSFTVPDAAGNLTENILEWWPTIVNHTDVVIARNDMETMLQCWPCKIKIFLAIEFFAKVIVSTTQEINKLLAATPAAREIAKIAELENNLNSLKQLEGQFKKFPTSECINQEVDTQQLNTACTFIGNLLNTVKALKQSTEEQREKQVVQDQHAVDQQIIAQQRQQIADLIAVQQRQQEQMNLLMMQMMAQQQRTAQ